MKTYRRIFFLSALVLAASIFTVDILEVIEEDKDYEQIQIESEVIEGPWKSSTESSSYVGHKPGNRTNVFYMDLDYNIEFQSDIDFESLDEEYDREAYTVRLALSDPELDDIADHHMEEIDEVGQNMTLGFETTVREVRQRFSSSNLVFRTAISDQDDNFLEFHSTAFKLKLDPFSYQD